MIDDTIVSDTSIFLFLFPFPSKLCERRLRFVGVATREDEVTYVVNG